MPRTSFKITGDIDEFNRIDNLYRVMRREGEKLLKNWEIVVEASFSESEEEAKAKK